MEIPKNGFIDLHVHLDGSLSFDMARELANIQGMEIKSEKELKKLMVAPKDCRDLNDYLTKFDYPLKLLQTEKAITYSVYELLKIQKLQGLVYSEIRFAPQLHTRKGLSQEQIVAAALRGTQGFSCGLILCCMRGANNQTMNLETLEAAEKYMGKGVVALDLAGAEALFPTENFEELFRKAGKKGIPFTIHAGEAAGPESIWKALEFGASRIGHGVRCLEDKVLVQRLAQDQIPLELCPTSNMNTKVFDNITRYPIMRFLDEGIKVTINTDNMTVSNTTLRKEFQLVSDTFRLNKTEIERLMKNAAESIFK
ncbi:adenosine deaminase [Frisingicoccus sp.]|uniref:adenosine deaminase n=1 Tax=Frisingicoccus sp. TaxID=1918627 RepID=UPI003AB3D9FE